ncbi:MAG TPA: hypothetical protein VHZ09_00945 [Acidobacteriaceae bacterium]|nr:hypothetical protein [Acidobacteriaceae bacterium]
MKPLLGRLFQPSEGITPGAQRSDILRIVFRQGLWIVGIGLALGLADSFGATRLVHSMSA